MRRPAPCCLSWIRPFKACAKRSATANRSSASPGFTTILCAAGRRHEGIMRFAAVRQTFFTIHMWVGLILGILLAALGLSGSLLVYDETVSDWLAPAPRAV